jgi:Flp pilus assembly protein TadG
MGQGAVRDGRARARGERGAALVEFAFVMVLLFTLIFGIISFGLILSFDQDMTRAAAEGARAGAVAFPATNAEADAEAALDEAIQDFGGPNWDGTGCEVGARAGLTCNATVGPCDVAVPTGDQCVFVDMSYDYDTFPLFGNVPLISEFMPSSIDASSVARTND